MPEVFEVKPLEWDRDDEATTPVGIYQLSESDVSNSDATIWEWDFESANDDCESGISAEFFMSREEAIASAQKDFEARMRQGLSPVSLSDLEKIVQERGEGT